MRASLVVGWSILAALTVPVYPEFYRSLPDLLRQFSGSMISMAVLVAVPLNALFLLGTWRYSRLRLGAGTGAGHGGLLRRPFRGAGEGMEDSRR
jgi:hypothetical protein